MLASLFQLINPMMSSALASCPTNYGPPPTHFSLQGSWLGSPSQPGHSALPTPSTSSHAHWTDAHFQHPDQQVFSLLPWPGLHSICRTRLITPTSRILSSDSSSSRKEVSFWWETVGRCDSHVMQLAFIFVCSALSARFPWWCPLHFR